jgi:lambda repressor-like predicted transcriptional regulator
MAFQRTKEEWTKIVEEFKDSGQTMTAFCAEHGINMKTLGNHVYRDRAGVEEPVKKRSLKEWGALIEAQRDSGMTMADWCRQHGITPDTMRTAAKRIKASAESIDKTRWVELNDEGKQKIHSLEKKEDILKPRRPCTHDKPISSDRLDGAGCGSIKIRAGELEIEVDASYPIEKLSILIERLAR